jgi:hypothetical protein
MRISLGHVWLVAAALAGCSSAEEPPSDGHYEAPQNKATKEEGPRASVEETGPVGSTTDTVTTLPGSPNASVFVPVEAHRVLDARPAALQLAANATLDVPVAGRFGVPRGATAVALHVAVEGGAAGGHVEVFPRAQYTPETVPVFSNINYMASRRSGNLVLVPLSEDGGITILNRGGAAPLTADVLGYFTAAGGDTGCALHLPPVKSAPVVVTSKAASWNEIALPAEYQGLDPRAVFVTVTVTGATAKGSVTMAPSKLAGAPSTTNLVHMTEERIMSSVTGVSASKFFAYSEVAAKLSFEFTAACATGSPGGYGVRFVAPARIYDSRSPTTTNKPVAGGTVSMPIKTDPDVYALVTNIATLSATVPSHLRTVGLSKGWMVESLPNIVSSSLSLSVLAGDVGQLSLLNQAGTPQAFVDVFAALVKL